MALLPFEDDSVTEEMVRRAEKELGETEDRRERALKELRSKIKDSRIVLYVTDDTFLLTFLRVRKFNVERAMTSLEDLLRTKIDYADIFSIMNFDEVLQLLKDKVIGILPYRAENGSTIIVIQFERFKFDEMKFSVFIRAIAGMALMIVISNPPTQVCGLNIIADTNNTSMTILRHVSLRHLSLLGRGINHVCRKTDLLKDLYFLPIVLIQKIQRSSEKNKQHRVFCSLQKKPTSIAYAIQRLLPARFKSMHIINAPTAIRIPTNMIRSLLSDKLKQRYYFHANSQEDLLKHFHPSILPKEYGGTCDYDNLSLVTKMMSLKQRYKDMAISGFEPKKQNK